MMTAKNWIIMPFAKIVLAVWLAILTAVPASHIAEAAGNGDVNGDGMVTREDLELLLSYVQGKTTTLQRMDNADVNGDGSVNVLDVTKLTNLLKEQSPVPPPDLTPDLTPDLDQNRNRKPVVVDNVRTLSNGWYKIITANGMRRVVDVGGAKTSPGSNIQLWDDVNVNQQKFYLENVGDKYFTLKAGHCNLYVVAADSSGRNYTNIVLANKGQRGSAAEQWRLIDAGGGLYYIESRLRKNLSFDCADRSNANGTNVQLWDRGNVSWNKWQFASVSAPVPIPPPPVSNGLLYPLKGRSIEWSSQLTTNGQRCDYVAPTGTPLYAPADGTVQYMQSYSTTYKKLASYGNQILFTSNDRKYTVRCAHLSRFHGVSPKYTSSLSFPCGTSRYKCSTIILATKQVKKGELLGYTGQTGNASGPHVHIEVKQNGVAVNPKNVFSTWN